MLHILLIDDSPHDRLLMTRILEEEFAEVSVETVASSEKLVTTLEKGHFDVAIAEYELSWHNGLSILKRIKSWFPDCLTILFTDGGSEELTIAAIEAGCDDYIAKSPRSYYRLISSIRTHLDLKFAQHRRKSLESRLPTLLNQFQMGVFRCRPDGQLLAANSVFGQLLGIPDRPPALDLNLHQCFAWQPPQSLETSHLSEFQVQRTDGQWIWVRLHQTLCLVEGDTVIEGLLEDITAQKPATEVQPDFSDRQPLTQESHHQTTNILERITDAFVLVDRNWRILYANSETARLNQTEVAAIVGKTHWEMWPWSVGTVIEQNYHRAIADQVAVHFDVFYEPLTMWLEIHAYPCAEGLSIYFRDISDRKQAEVELYHREQIFKSIAHNTPDIIVRLSSVLDVTERQKAETALWQSQELLTLAQKIGKIGACEWNLQTGRMLWTAEMEALYGVAPGTFGGTYEDWLTLIHPDDRPQVNQLAQQLPVEGQDFQIEFRIQQKDGGLRWMSAKASVLNDSSGKPQRVVGVNMDITDLKLAEAGLRESEQRFRAAQELSLDGFTALRSVRDEAGEIVDFEWTYVNPKAAEMLGTSVEELVGNRLLKVLPGNKTNSELFARYIQVAETGVPHDLELYYESEGIEGWFRNMTVKLNDGIAISFSDITKRKQAEVERAELLERERRARLESESANRVKDEFLAVLSHELRSPLNSILGWSKLLRSRQFDAATTAKALETIERNAALQAQLIEDLLDVSRIIRGKVNLNLETVNLVSTVLAAIETMRLAAEAKAIDVRFSVTQGDGLERRVITQSLTTDNSSEIATPEVLVLGDPSRLQQVVWNLLSNAIKFTNRYGLVEITLEQSETWAKIQVKDTGKGISQEFLPYVFEYFRQADASTTRCYGGLGLGLAIVHHLVELHGGHVKADSAGEGQGATFTVLLPPVEVPSSEKVDPELPKIPTVLRGIRILVVDDDVDTLELLAFTLMECGVEVMALSRVGDALAIIGQFKPDIIISDIGMPEEDGYSFLHKVRLLPPEEGGNTPAVAVTAYARPEDRSETQAVGFQRHLSKPIEPDRLIAIVVELYQSTKTTST